MSVYIECCSISTPYPPYKQAIECDCKEEE
jgi:hypothetical protein